MSTLKVHGRCVNSNNCPIIEASKIVGDFWNLWIIRVLFNGPKRFTHILNDIPPLNKATLNIKLKALIEAKIISKSFDKDLKPQYELSKLGSKLEQFLIELEKFGNDNFR